jgi:hypothetical protein
MFMNALRKALARLGLALLRDKNDALHALSQSENRFALMRRSANKLQARVEELESAHAGHLRAAEENALVVERLLVEAKQQREAVRAAKEMADRLSALVNSPELHDFSKAVVLEAAHQRERWGADHDAGKGPGDWLWLIAHLCTRALEHHKEAERLTDNAAMSDHPPTFHAVISHHREKAMHHTITAAAALANWHAFVAGKHTGMRPGIDPASNPITAEAG